MHTYVYIYCIYIYTHTYVYLYIYVHIMHTHTYIYICMHISIYTAYIYIYIHTYTCTYTAWTHTNMSCSHAYTHTSTYNITIAHTHHNSPSISTVQPKCIINSRTHYLYMYCTSISTIQVSTEPIQSHTIMYTPHIHVLYLPCFNRYQACNPNGARTGLFKLPQSITIHINTILRQDTSHLTHTIPQEHLYIIIHSMQVITQPRTGIQASNTYIHHTVQVDFKQLAIN